MNNLKTVLLTFLNNQNYIDALSMVVVAITSYQVAKYTASRPNKLKIKQLQLDCIYLPMYRILVNLPHSLNKNIAQEVSNKLNSLLDAHYELAFPQLHKLNKDLQSALIDDRNYEYIIRIIYHQIAVDYELLKKSLGYPSENFISLFVRMTTKQKCEFIISWVNIFWIFSPIILFFPLKAIYPTHHFSICLGIVILLSIPLCLINKCIKEMKD